MLKSSFILIPLLFLNLSFGQSKIDSPEKRLDVEKIDSLRFNVLLSLFDEYQYENPPKAKEYITNALELAAGIELKKYRVMALNAYADLLNGQAQNDSAIALYKTALSLADQIEYTNGKGIALLGLGNTYLSKGNLKSAKEYHLRNITFAENIGDFEGAASSYNNLGNIYNETGEYAKAMENYTLASKKNIAINNEKNAGIAMANIGLIHQKLTNYKEAIDYYEKSDSLFKKFDFLPGRAFVLKNMGVVFKNQGDLDAALELYNDALKNYEQMGLKREMGQVLENIGNIFFEEGHFDKAVGHYRQSLTIANDMQDTISIAMASQALGNGFLKLRILDSAEIHSKKAVGLAKSAGINLTAMDGHMTLADVYFSKSDYQRAYDHLFKHKLLRDSLYTIEKRDLAEEIEAKYQNEQKTKEIALLTSEKELQTLQLTKKQNERNAIIAFAILTIILALLLYNQYRIKKRSNQELQELDQAKSNFFANISHEFRTPLTLIKGPIEHVEQNPEEQLDRDHIKMIRRNTNRVLALVNQLLDLSKIDQKRLQLKTTEGDIFRHLRTAAASFNSLAAHRHIEYRVDIPSDILWAAFDRDKVEKIVYNLLSNAFKFSDDEDMISIKAEFVDRELRIDVSDTGRGISKKSLPFVFDRFYQEDSGTTKEKEGSGIGLSLSRDLVELMDGTITVSSELGKGSFFTVHLPMEEIRTAQPKEQEYVNSKKTQLPKTFDFEKSDTRNIPSVLLVEDNEDMRTFLTEHLSKHYRVIKATNGEEGLRKATSKVPDLIITDLMMPKMDGIELSTKLKTTIETSHIPIIMLTAKAGVENKIQGLETGADDYLTKPFDARELLVRTSNLIEQRRNLRALFVNKDIQLQPAEITVTSLDQKFLEQVLELLEQQYTNSDFGVTDMQKNLNMSKSQFHRKMKALTNESPGELLRNFRLKRAAQLLSQEADTVTQIAYKVGFNDLSYFTKCFKALYGTVPSAYVQ